MSGRRRSRGREFNTWSRDTYYYINPLTSDDVYRRFLKVMWTYIHVCPYDLLLKGLIYTIDKIAHECAVVIRL